MEVVHWNPEVTVLPGRLGYAIGWRRPVNNFGDLLGPMLVRRILEQEGALGVEASGGQRLLSVGSILHLARDGDVVWGSGWNGKVSEDRFQAGRLDVRAVRGPLTRDFLLRRGIRVPDVFGDPGLLLGVLRPDLAGLHRQRSVLHVPNLNDRVRPDWRARTLNPRSGLEACLRTIASSDFVVGSSLHGVVVAEALGVGARFVRSRDESDFKYRDYLLGTGRPEYAFASSPDEAVRLGPAPPPRWDPDRLRRAFPLDLLAPS